MSINQIISRFFLGKASTEELNQLEEWKAESEENVAALTQMKNINSAYDDLKGYQEFDEGEAWSIVERQMDSDEPVKVIPLGRWIAAASVVLLVSLGWWSMGSDTFGKDGIYQSDSENASFSLTDGSQIILEEGSTLTVKEIFSTDRNVHLEGRARFDVSHDPSSPFTIQTNRASIQVLGTTFTVLDEIDRFEVIVTEGRVNVRMDNRSVELNQGEMVILENNGLIKLPIRTNNHGSWIDEELIFSDASVYELFEAVKRHYKVDIELDETLDTNVCKISTVYKDVSLDVILSELSELFNLEYENIEGKILISQFKC